MNFIQMCMDDSLPIWESGLNSDFLCGIADGSLDENCFKGYIVDDSLYLREYAKVFAWGMLRAEDMEEIRAYYSLLSFVNEAEDSTRRYYLKRYHLDDSAIQKLPLRPQNQAYVDEMLNAAKTWGGTAECLMASLPCMLSYGWIFKEMIYKTPGVQSTIYSRFVSDYAGEHYEKLCGDWIAFANEVCSSLSPERQERCLSIFHACSVHELHFWEMSASPRLDI